VPWKRETRPAVTPENSRALQGVAHRGPATRDSSLSSGNGQPTDHVKHRENSSLPCVTH